MERIIWHGTTNSFFPVRSAYHMEKLREVVTQGQASSSNDFKEVWNKIWQLSVTTRDKVCIWRSCLEALPTQSNLFKNKVVNNPLCPICCKRVVRLKKCALPQAPMLLFFESLSKVFNSEDLHEFVVVARKLWWRRNTFVSNKEFTHPNSIVREARILLDMMFKGDPNPQSNSRASQGCSSEAVWKVPSLPWFKINWDWAVDKANEVVIWDCAGQIIATMRQRKQFFPDLLAEAYGALQAVKLGLELGLH
ncbi:uncharacterized protein LOC122301697 [Carya illinoinensis]|uniref:uncharacterized protein LOC122301697 n=1 Tax=Carya illinoinensis TaxID=32201 RepID=UPI001C720B5F|nr:uncharacterized protein LOC122301697 [Carya illinoinensis]